MIKMIQAHIKRKEIQARAAAPKVIQVVSMSDIKRKLEKYQPVEGMKKANFDGPSLNRKEFEGAM